MTMKLMKNVMKWGPMADRRTANCWDATPGSTSGTRMSMASRVMAMAMTASLKNTMRSSPSGSSGEALALTGMSRSFICAQKQRIAQDCNPKPRSPYRDQHVPNGADAEHRITAQHPANGVQQPDCTGGERKDPQAGFRPSQQQAKSKEPYAHHEDFQGIPDPVLDPPVKVAGEGLEHLLLNRWDGA